MISLHSCFVAGLTLMYCVWRDRSLFSYDVFEATQACSQSLTIFGEKWSGAVKYRDIFDALSASLFKTLVTPIGTSDTAGLDLRDTDRCQPLKAELDRGSTIPIASPASEAESGDEETQESSMSQLVSDAVKEAFMEVDEEAPGGWQGWRMWNEMLGEGPSGEQLSMHDLDGIPRDNQADEWQGSHVDQHSFVSDGIMQDRVDADCI